MSDYTKKEIELINRAWRALEYRAEVASQSYALESALKIERKLRSSIHIAKALILIETLNFWRHDPKASELTSTAIGIIAGALAGLAAIKRTENVTGWMPCDLATLSGFMKEVETMHTTSICRRLDKISITEEVNT